MASIASADIEAIVDAILIEFDDAANLVPNGNVGAFVASIAPRVLDEDNILWGKRYPEQDDQPLPGTVLTCLMAGVMERVLLHRYRNVRQDEKPWYDEYKERHDRLVQGIANGTAALPDVTESAAGAGLVTTFSEPRVMSSDDTVVASGSSRGMQDLDNLF